MIEGTATDEALANLLAGTAKDGPMAAALTAPANGARVPSAPVARFEWSTPTARSSPPARAKGPTAWPFGPMRAAYAHGAAMSGRGYLLTLKAGGANVVRVFTTNTSYTPDASAWNRLVTAKSITATITTASFDNNNLVAGSGPFVGAGTTFTIEP